MYLVFASLVSHGGGSGLLAFKKENGCGLLAMCNSSHEMVE